MITRFLLLAFFINVTTTVTVRAQTSFAPLAERLMPSVVNISTQQQEEQDNPDVQNNLLFASPDGRAALGSGFAVSADGYIATNYHVIEGAKKISVVTFDDKVYEAKVIGTDAKTDIALIKINNSDPMQPVDFGDSDKIRIGDWVLAIGNPFGLGSSVTAGIISAKSRDIESGPYDDYLQTDASINQGNSGGPMFDMNGKLIGINTAIFSTVGNSVGVGFALPSNQAKWVLEELKNKGKVERGWLGISVKQAKTETGISGLAIVSFADNKIAKQSPLQLGDIILSVNDMAISSAKDFSLSVSRMAKGTKLNLSIWRNGKITEVAVYVQQMPDEIPDNDKINNSFSDKQISSAQYDALGLYFDGFRVIQVMPGSEAAEKGIRSGDVLKRINGIAIYVTDELDRKIQEALISGEPLRLEFVSEESGEPYFVELSVVKSGV